MTTDAPKTGTSPRGRRRWPVTVLVLALSGAGTYAYLTYTGDGRGLPGVNEVSAADAQQQSTLVDQEDLRVMQTRAVLSSALARGGPRAAQVRQPHISSSANGRTLVLTPRSQPYYVADLERYGQEDFERQRDGSYLLGIHLFVADGAKLVLQSATGPLTIRLKSGPGAFTSIVGFGASIRLNGSAQNPVRITSWNDQESRPDTRVADGRAYLRAIGGEFRMKHAQVSDLGFWSGRTGGIALTGSDRPSESAERVASGAARPGRTVLLPDGRTETTSGGGSQIEVAAGKGGAPAAFVVPAANLVTGSIQNSTILRDAYGVFISGSNETRLIDNTVRDSLVNGVMLHRFARNASIENTTVTGSRGDGFVLSRATQNVKISGSLAERNGGNGFTLDGSPLATGPSASGESMTAFGDSSVSSSTARDNGHYGVEVRGGVNLAVQTSKIIGGDMGIVVTEQAKGVQISGNQLTGQKRQGIALRGGVTGAQVSGNLVTGARTAVYLRESSAAITGNTVNGASLHAITVIGAADGTRIAANTLSGAGRSVIDDDRAGPLTVTGNNTAGWKRTAGFWTLAKRIFKPMNVIWASVFLLVIVSALRSSSARGFGRHGRHPYDAQRHLEERPVRLLNHRGSAAAGAAGTVGATDIVSGTGEPARGAEPELVGTDGRSGG